MRALSEYHYRDADEGWSNSYVLPVVLRELRRSGGPVLDLGCGNGALVHRLLGEGIEAYGMDSSESGVAHASSRAPGRFWRMDVEAGDLPPALRAIPFRTIVSTEVIEHLYDPLALLKLAATALQPRGGTLVLSTPYHGYLKNVLVALGGRYDQHHTALWHGGHIKFFSRATLQALLRQAGFEPVGFEGAGRVPYLWKSMVITARLAAA